MRNLLCVQKFNLYYGLLKFFMRTFFSHLVGPSGTHEKLSCGCKIG